MRLNFKTHFPWPINGTPPRTNFLEQVKNALAPGADIYPNTGRKLHTLRRMNGKRRFREGMTLQFSTGPRFKQAVFDEALCTGVQLVYINALHREFMAIDGPPCHSWQLVVQLGSERGRLMPLKELAKNDGLELHEFTRWFLLDVLENGPGMYELVHWTNLRYE